MTNPLTREVYLERKIARLERDLRFAHGSKKRQLRNRIDRHRKELSDIAATVEPEPIISYPEDESATAPPPEEVNATQGAIEFAAENGITDLSEIEGTGYKGKITKGDVEDYIASKDQ